MKIILVAAFTVYASAFAYDREHISLSGYEFRRYVRPQLRSISNEFRSLFFALNPGLEDYKSLYSNFRELDSINQSLGEDCVRASASCQDLLKKAAILLLEISEELDGNKTPDALGPDSSLSFQHKQELLRQAVARALEQTGNMLFQNILSPAVQADVPAYSSRLNALSVRFNAVLFQHSDSRFKNEINSFWNDFAKPTQNIVLEENDMDFFKQRLTALNLAWNMLHVRLSKRGYTPSKRVSALINIMHRRWNNILKVSLKPKG